LQVARLEPRKVDVGVLVPLAADDVADGVLQERPLELATSGA
jgi:hypothetical protein